jgi:hypothetical protein
MQGIAEPPRPNIRQRMHSILAVRRICVGGYMTQMGDEQRSRMHLHTHYRGALFALASQY